MTTRRHFLRKAATLTALPFVPNLGLGSPTQSKPDSKIDGVQIGVITYSYRSMPDQSPEAVLGYVVDSGISAVELMGNHAIPFAGTDLDKFEQLRRRYEDAGVSIYAYKPRAFGKDNTDEEINHAMRAARALGASHVTLEHPADDEHTAKLGDMASQHGLRVAYHGHTQQTPTFWDTALGQSNHNALNLDIGHYVAAGYTDDALNLVRRKHEHIASIHMKDRQSPANDKKNLPWGQGDTPLVDLLTLMRREGYTFPGTIELEYEIPEGSDAVAEVRRCLEFCRGALVG